MNGTHARLGYLRDRPNIYKAGEYWRVREARSQYWKRPNQADTWARWIAAHAYVAWLNKQPNVKPLDEAQLADVLLNLQQRRTPQ